MFKASKLFIADMLSPTFVGVSMSLGLVKTFVSTYVFSDWKFAAFLFVVVGFDTALGVLKAIREKSLDTKGIGLFLEKIVLYCAVLAVGHVLVNYKIAGMSGQDLGYIRNTLYSAMLFREVLSILKHGASKYPGMFSQVLKYFKGYDQNGVPEKKEK